MKDPSKSKIRAFCFYTSYICSFHWKYIQLYLFTIEHNDYFNVCDLWYKHTSLMLFLDDAPAPSKHVATVQRQTLEMSIPHNKVGPLIGREGINIKRVSIHL